MKDYLAILKAQRAIETPSPSVRTKQTKGGAPDEKRLPEEQTKQTEVPFVCFGSNQGDRFSPDWADDHAERAAVVQYDGGVPAAYADAFAMVQMRCPDNVPIERWQQFIDDAGKFFDRWGAVAEHLGWTVADLLGLDPHAPMTRYDAQGLIWMLHGDAVVLMEADAATLSRAA